MFFSPIESKIVYLKWSDLKLGGLCWNSNWWNRVCVLFFFPTHTQMIQASKKQLLNFCEQFLFHSKVFPPKMYLKPWVFTLRRNPKRKHNLPGFTAFYGFFLTHPQKKGWTWKTGAPPQLFGSTTVIKKNPRVSRGWLATGAPEVGLWKSRG